MVQQKSNRLSLLFAAVLTLFASVIQPARFSDVAIDNTSPCKKLSSLMLQHVDAIGYPAKLSCLGDATTRYAGTSLADYMQMAGTAAEQFEAESAWNAIAPVQYHTSFQHAVGDVFADIAVSGEGSLVALAAGNDGVFVYNKNMELLRHFMASEITAGSDPVFSVAFHPTRPWLAVGTEGAGVGQVFTFNLESKEINDWVGTLTLQSGLTSGIQSVRFSPDGNYVASKASADLSIFAVPATYGAWTFTPLGEFDSVPTVTSSTGHISWMSNSLGFAFVNNVAASDVISVVHKYAAAEVVGSGLTVPLTFTSPFGVAFNAGCDKLAVIEADTVKIVNTSDVKAANWDLYKQADGTTDFEISSGSQLINVLFHPQVDILAVSEGFAGMVGTADMRLFDLRNVSPQKVDGTNAWAEISVTDVFPYLVRDRGTDNAVGPVPTFGLVWDKWGTRLYLSSNGVAMANRPNLDVFDSHNDDPATWTRTKSLQYHRQPVSVVASSATGNLLATAELVSGGVIKIWDTTNDIQVHLSEIGDSGLATSDVDLDIPTLENIRAMAFSPDAKYLFVGFQAAGPTHRILVINVTDPTAPTLASTVTTIDPDREINSIAVTKLNAPLIGKDLYFVATGMADAGTSPQIDFRAFDPDTPAFSTLNLADGSNDFGQHGTGTLIDPVLTASADIRVAIRGARMVTASKFGDTTDKPEVKAWNIQQFVNSLTALSTPPVAVQLPVVRVNTTTVGTWHADDETIATLDLSADGNLIATGDASDNVVMLTSILNLLSPVHVDTYTYAAVVSHLKFSPFSKYTTPTKDGYLSVVSSSQTIDGETGEVFVYDLTATTPLSSAAPNFFTAYAMNLTDTAQVDWGRKGYKLYAGGTDGVTTRYHINQVVSAMAQTVVNHYNPTLGLTNQQVAQEFVKDLACLACIDLDDDANVTDIETVAAVALDYLSKNPGDVFGVARTIQRSLDSTTQTPTLGLDDFCLARVAAKRYATFDQTVSPPLFAKAHLSHPVDLAVECDNKFNLSREFAHSYAKQIFRCLRQYQGFDLESAPVTDDGQLICFIADVPVDQHFSSIASVAHKHGLDCARYVAGLGYPNSKDLVGVGDELAVAAFDYVVEHQNEVSSEVTLIRNASKSLTNTLRGLNKQHVDSMLCRALAQHADNYIRFGKGVMDCMGLLPVDKAGVTFEKTTDIAWSHDDKYLFVAAGEGGLLVFDCNCNFLKCIPADSLGGRVEADQPLSVNSITAHPSQPWLVIGTNDTTVTEAPTGTFKEENVVAIDFSSADCDDWLCTKITMTNAVTTAGAGFSAEEVLSVRFSPNGQYLVSTRAGIVPPKVVDVSNTFEDWPTSTVFTSLPNLTTVSTGHIAWDPDSSRFVVISTPTDLAVITSTPSTNTFTVPSAISLTGAAYNGDGTKLAVTDANCVGIINATVSPVTSWDYSQKLTVATDPGLRNPIFHPTKDLLVVTDDFDQADVRVFDLTAKMSSRWSEYNSTKDDGKFPYALSPSKLFDPENACFGVAWNQRGTQLAVGNNDLANNDNKADVVIFSTNKTSAAKWNCKRATFCYDYAYALSVGVFDALRADPMDAGNIANARNILTGLATDVTSTQAGLVTAINNLDLKKVVPIALTTDVRQDAMTGGDDFVGGALNGLTPVVAAAAVMGSGYAHGVPDNTLIASDIISISAAEQMAKDLTEPPTGGSLPIGNLINLTGNAVENGPDCFGNAAQGEFGPSDSILHGPFGSVGSYYTALFNDLMHPTNGLIANVDAYADLTCNEKEVIARAIIMHITFRGSEVAVRDVYDGTNNPALPLAIATLVKDVMRNFAVGATYIMPTGTSIPFASLPVSVRQAIAMVAILFPDYDATALIDSGNSQVFEPGNGVTTVVGTSGAQETTAVAHLNAVLQAAFLAATYAPCPTDSAVKNTAIQEEMAVLGGLGAFAMILEGIKDVNVTPANELLVATDTLKDEVSQVGRELSRGLVSGEQLKGLAAQDLGSQGLDQFVVDMSEQLLAAVGGIIVLETRATIEDQSAGQGSAAATAANIGSFAAGLAYNQFFRCESVARAIAKLAIAYKDRTLGKQAAIFSAVSGDPTDEEAGQIASAALDNSNLSRARYAVNQMYKKFVDFTTTSPAPALTHPENLVINHITDILKNPVNFVLNLNNVPLCSDTAESRAQSPFGHPEQMAKEIATQFGGISDNNAAALACDVYSRLSDECGYGMVDAAGAHCDGLNSMC